MAHLAVAIEVGLADHLLALRTLRERLARLQLPGHMRGSQRAGGADQELRNRLVERAPEFHSSVIFLWTSFSTITTFQARPNFVKLRRSMQQHPCCGASISWRSIHSDCYCGCWLENSMQLASYQSVHQNEPIASSTPTVGPGWQRTEQRFSMVWRSCMS